MARLREALLIAKALATAVTCNILLPLFLACILVAACVEIVYILAALANGGAL